MYSFTLALLGINLILRVKLYQKVKKMRKNKEFIEIYGFHSVKAALKNSNRKNNKLIITKKNKEKLNSKLLLKLNEIVELPIIKINKIYGNEDIHQGIVLKTSKLTQPSIDDIMDRANKEK